MTQEQLIDVWEAALATLCEADELPEPDRRTLKKIIAVAGVKLASYDRVTVVVDPEVNGDAAFIDFWAAYQPSPDQEEYKLACRKMFLAKLHEGHAANDIIEGARIAAAKGWNHRFPYKWIEEHRWIALLKQFGGTANDDRVRN